MKTTHAFTCATRGAVNAILGLWLFLSAFAWPDTDYQMVNTAILGALCVIFAMMATECAPVHHLNTLLAVWLFISVWALPTTNPATVWNSVLIAVLVFAVSLVQSDSPDPPLRSHA